MVKSRVAAVRATESAGICDMIAQSALTVGTLTAAIWVAQRESSSFGKSKYALFSIPVLCSEATVRLALRSPGDSTIVSQDVRLLPHLF